MKLHTTSDVAVVCDGAGVGPSVAGGRADDKLST